MSTFAWVNPEGQWLVISESTTHTGHHVQASFTTNVNEAYVGYMKLPRITNRVDLSKLCPVPARSERRVILGPPQCSA